MTNDELFGVRQSEFVIRRLQKYLSPRREQHRERDADGCAKVAHQFDRR